MGIIVEDHKDFESLLRQTEKYMLREELTREYH
jgi:hypothetical protein